MKYELPNPNSVTCHVKDDIHHVLWLGKYVVVEFVTYQTIEYCLANSITYLLYNQHSTVLHP